MDNQVIDKLKEVEFRILCDFDGYCKKHSIKYSIYAGTMLGAVRHKGFIPWDDDIDVVLTRENFKKLTEKIKVNPLEGYAFENCIDDKYCGFLFGKLRKLNTTFIAEVEVENSPGHHEIFIDIFVLDKISNNKKLAVKTKKLGIKINLLTRANVTRNDSSLKKRIARTLLKIIPINLRHKIIVNSVKKIEQLDEKISSDYKLCSMSTLENIKNLYYPKEMVENYTELQFNNKMFPSFADYDGMLKIIYGDYMKLPPKEEQINKHNPVKIVF